MKPITMLISALAAVASAAPAATGSQEKRGKMDFGKFNNLDRGEYNNFAFANEELQYFDAINELDLKAFVKLSAFNDLDISDFKQLFVRDELDIDALLQLQVVVLLSQLAAVGLFDDFDLAVIKVKTIDLGLLSDIGRFDVASLIDDSVVPDLQDAIQKSAEVKAVFFSDDDNDDDDKFKGF
ncbi:hypothetical protein DL770_002072 [Monosporascus sp. CRB-9-2]|nr:hypothetical protein DL770_002072 [Monosporascus sp. CRB-9-2]